MTGPQPDPDELARRAAQVIGERTGIAEHDVAVVLGSGWSAAIAALGSPTAVLAQTEVPGFTPPSAAGHAGELLSVPVGDHRVLVLAGRIHAYEGHDLRHVVHPVRTACAAGARTVVLTNAAGGLRPDMQVGQPVLISDHLNLTARSPLVGAQFVDLTDAYSARLRAVARQADPSWPKACTPACRGRITRHPPRSACCGCWAPTWSACRRCTRPLPPARRGPRCSVFRW
ncbi:purine nucleoside phosphorylase [Mycobacterium ulcerans str. Harvey]|uniref:purine-nucleoside phosphorylase n=1 Tax=Mycobacterium ulcerans str. Harvey TaxID=1299332 RepID=A0ABP3AF52_MYCUL|nr:purine nucleoside phosphorylase [Mycobacterium ulcerans str. Harvey]